jgi:hypothetical protein
VDTTTAAILEQPRQCPCLCWQLSWWRNPTIDAGNLFDADLRMMTPVLQGRPSPEKSLGPE